MRAEPIAEGFLLAAGGIINEEDECSPDPLGVEDRAEIGGDPSGDRQTGPVRGRTERKRSGSEICLDFRPRGLRQRKRLRAL